MGWLGSGPDRALRSVGICQRFANVTKMSERYGNEWVASLLDMEARLGQTTPAELLAGLGLGEGHTIVDIGCGPGFLTFPAAEIVGPEGHVYALDIEPKMVDMVRTEATSRGLSNITALRTDGDGVFMSDGIADFAICALVLHYRPDFASRAALLRDIGRVLRPGGRLLIVDRSLGSKEIGALLEEADLPYDGPNPLEGNAYTMIATRRPVADDRRA